MLPVEEIVPALQAQLAESTAAVLVAPPGAGKTTVVPLRLLDQPWLAGGKIIMLEPRRLAARAAAERMARTLGERVGQTVGYRVRMQSKVSGATRIEVVTEGVFARMILSDPTLDGVGCVIFDEFHERSLDADLGLALARDAQGVLRDDLRLLVMSATLDGAAVARLLDAKVLESQGRTYPVETRYLGRDERLRLEDRVVRAVEKALAEETGSLLVFLPGQGEIRRTADLLTERIRRPGVEITPLYGALDPAEQDRAISPAPAGVRKVVLATSIAETSLTIEGVRVVIDCGLARVPRFDPASGLTRLATVRVSRAAADQRRGRAGRTEPGVCYRLWDEPETRALPAFADPEILDAELSGLALDLARWGAKDAGDLAFLDPPPAAAYAEARSLLRRLEAVDDAGVLTDHGRALSEFPLAPRLAHMVIKAAETGQAPRAARIAALVTERNLGGRDADLRHRLEGLERDRSPRARDAKALADRWAGLAGKAGRGEPLDDGLLLAFAYPERIAKARGGQGEFQLAGGRGAFVEATDALAREPWLAVAELGGGEGRAPPRRGAAGGGGGGGRGPRQSGTGSELLAQPDPEGATERIGSHRIIAFGQPCQRRIGIQQVGNRKGKTDFPGQIDIDGDVMQELPVDPVTHRRRGLALVDVGRIVPPAPPHVEWPVLVIDEGVELELGDRVRQRSGIKLAHRVEPGDGEARNLERIELVGQDQVGNAADLKGSAEDAGLSEGPPEIESREAGLRAVDPQQQDL